jgi:hypothetical protein
MNIQELTDSIKRPNLNITGTEEGEVVQAKGIHKIFNKIKQKFPKSRESYANPHTGSFQDAKQT